MKRMLSRILLLFALALLVIPVSPATGHAQALPECKYVAVGHTCSPLPGQACDAGGGERGVCTLQRGDNACDCIVKTGYTLNVSPMVPSPVTPPNESTGFTGTSSSTITVTPVGGYTGTVTVTCSLGGRYMTCVTPSAQVVVPGTLTETVSMANAVQGAYAISFAATDANGVPPNNGNPQNATLVVNNVGGNVTAEPVGGGTIALGTFMGLLLIWGLWRTRMRKKLPSSEY